MPFYNEIKDHTNIVISFTSNPRYDFGTFAKGYHQAANQLAENFLSNSKNLDYNGYPIIFLYRHALELNLKNIVYWSMRLCAFKNIDILDTKLYNNHDLIQLASLIAILLSKLFAEDPHICELIKIIEKTAKEFHEIDSTSFSYRYPINKDGDYSTERHQVVNIRSIYKNIGEMLNKLEIINFGLNIETEQAQEIYESLNNYIQN